MAEYVLFNECPALVIEREDGKKYIRLATARRMLTFSEVTDKWKRLKSFSHMSEPEFRAAYGAEYTGTELPLDVMKDAGCVRELPAGYWQKIIPAKWWAAAGKRGVK